MFILSFAEALIEVIAEPKISVVTALLPPRGPGQICRMNAPSTGLGCLEGILMRESERVRTYFPTGL